MHKRLHMGMLVLAFWMAAYPAWAGWNTLGNAIKLSSSQDAEAPDAAVATYGALGETIFVTWQEYDNSYDTYQIYAGFWNGSSWRNYGTSGTFVSLNDLMDDNATNPSIAVDNNTNPNVYVSWQEDKTVSQIFVKKSSGTTWTTVGSMPLNINAGSSAVEPELVVTGENYPIIVWREKNAGGYFKIYAKRYTGGSWNSIPSTGLPVDSAVATLSAFAFNMEISATDNVYLAWQEDGVDDKDAANNIYVAHWNDLLTKWGSLTPDGLKDLAVRAAEPAVACNNADQPVVVYVQGPITNATLRVKVYSPSLPGWKDIASPVTGGYVSQPRVAVDSNDWIYVAWQARPDNKQIVARVWNGTSWSDLDNTLNVNSAQEATNPEWVIWNDQPLAVFDEAGTVYRDVYARYWIPPTSTPTMTVTPVVTATPTKALSASPTVTQTSAVHMGENEAKTYPLPASNQVHFVFRIQDGEGDPVVRIYNTHYRLVAEVAGTHTVDGSGKITWDCSSVAPGIYFYQVVSGDKKTGMQKLIIAR